MEKTVLIIDEQGRALYLEGPGAGPPPPVKSVFKLSRRAGRVEPVKLWKRLAFRALRLLLGDKGRIASWTRSWKGPWRADLRLSGGPVLHEAATREEAVRMEVRWLIDHDFGDDVAT